MQYGLLGRHLSHSYSPQIHLHLGTVPYHLFEEEPQNVEAFLHSGCFKGINVTIPYKKAVIPYCDDLTSTAKALGAVNTIVRKSDGKLLGHNSDYYGFYEMLRQSGLNITGKKALVLGSGGSSVTVSAVLKEAQANVIVVSRSGENNYSNLDQHYDAALIVNTTPVGMYPDVDAAPIDIAPFTQLEGVLDLIYNPARTQLICAAQKRNLVTMNGLWMLVAQAKESAEWFLGHKILDGITKEIHAKLRAQMENIILIGMPGCGKSTLGRKLAEQMDKEFIDADSLIQALAGKTIPEIFAESGEEGFRRLESEVLAELGKRSGLVIATGGGCVTRTENYAPLHQNGTIIWIKRDITQLPTEGRPLSKPDLLAQMYQLRMPLYVQFSDLAIANDSTIEITLQRIQDALNEEYKK